MVEGSHHCKPPNSKWACTLTSTAHKFSVKDFFSKCDHKCLMENFSFCAVYVLTPAAITIIQQRRSSNMELCGIIYSVFFLKADISTELDQKSYRSRRRCSRVSNKTERVARKISSEKNKLRVGNIYSIPKIYDTLIMVSLLHLQRWEDRLSWVKSYSNDA